MITYLLVTSREHWLYMVLPGTWAHCRWYLGPWLQILIQVLGACWCWCQQPGRAGCSKASPPYQDFLRHGCPPLFGQLWKWSQPLLLRECTSLHCPPYRGQCVAARQNRKKKDRLSANIGTDNDSLNAPGKGCQGRLFHKDSQGNWLRIKEQIHFSAQICKTLSHEKNKMIVLSEHFTD